jgi:hypothetical protein
MLLAPLNYDLEEIHAIDDNLSYKFVYILIDASKA